MRLGPTAAARFWSKVDRSNEEGCWTWLASTNARGYGWFNALGAKGGRPELSHRVAWVLENGGQIPDGMFVCHRCDNPACVRPDHLFLGSNNDNMADMKAKGRAVSPRALWTHCKKGHELTPENTVVRKWGNQRRCRTCLKEYTKEHNRRSYLRRQAMIRVAAMERGQ